MPNGLKYNWTEEQKQYFIEQYLKGKKMKEIQKELKEKFGYEYSTSRLYHMVRDLGLVEKRKIMKGKILQKQMQKVEQLSEVKPIDVARDISIAVNSLMEKRKMVMERRKWLDNKIMEEEDTRQGMLHAWATVIGREIEIEEKIANILLRSAELMNEVLKREEKKQVFKIGDNIIEF